MYHYDNTMLSDDCKNMIIVKAYPLGVFLFLCGGYMGEIGNTSKPLT